MRNIFLTALFVGLFALSSFGQSANVQKDLSETFKNFNLVKLNKQNARRQVESIQPLSIQAADKNLELNLVSNDLRADNYQAEDTNYNGVRTLEKGEVTTFKGKVAGEADSDVRLSINGAAIEGYVAVGGEKFFIEPARNFSKSANADDVVVYRAEDLLKSDGFTCETELTRRIESGKRMVAANGVETAQDVRLIELATDADYQFVTALGGATQANNEILSTLNMVQGTYEKDLNLSVMVTYQHTWTAADPFDGTTTTTLLNSFVSYWNASIPTSQRPRDAAHLFSAKPNALGQGLAYIGVICKNPSVAYALSGRTDYTSINSLVTGHEIGHNLGATHVDATQSCANSTMNPVLSNITPSVFCAFSQNQISAYVTTNAACLKTKTVPAAATKHVPFDFDGDGRSDIAVWRQTNGVWYITNSASASFNFVQFGSLGDRVVPADFDGDGKADIAVYRAGLWFILKSSTNSFDAVAFGNSTDIPMPADFDGDGKADVAVFRPSDGVWHRLLSGSGNSYSAVQFGASGDVPMPGDFDGDGKADISVWRPSNGVWYRLNSSNNSFYAVQFGSAEDKPVMGDFDGDKKADIAVWRPSNGVWYQLSSSNGAFTGAGFGSTGDIPVAADYDGDGRTDVSVFRPSNGFSYCLNSSNGGFVSTQFGAVGDVPISSAFNR